MLSRESSRRTERPSKRSESERASSSNSFVKRKPNETPPKWFVTSLSLDRTDPLLILLILAGGDLGREPDEDGQLLEDEG